MSTKRTAPSGQRRASKTTTSTSTAKRERERALDASEEKVVRMRRGITVPDDMPLGRIGQTHPATRAKLMELEKRAFERSGRLDELRRDVGLPATSTDSAKKQKIISKLSGASAKKKVAAPKKKIAAPSKAKRR
jgi:hypothetical protein